MKLFLYAEHVLTCYAARKLGRPVKWAADAARRSSATPRAATTSRTGELAIDKDGKFLALRTRNIANMGAYLSTFAPYIPTYAGTSVLASVYGFQAVYANVLGVFTHTVPVDAYRGAGRPEANYMVERLVDATARELNIDRIELRRRNMVPPSAMPHATPVGKTYDSGDFRAVLDAGLEKIGWAGFAAAPGRGGARGKRRGLGLSYYLEATGGDPTERAEIRFADDGFVDVYVGTQSTGQGHETAYVQLTSTRLGIDGEKIRIRQGDTDTIPVGGGTGGARSLYSEGQAILVTTDTVIEQGQAGGGRGAGGGGRRYRLRRRAVHHRRHRSRDRPPASGRDAAQQGRRAASRRPRSTPPRSPRSTSTPSRTAATSPRSRSIPRPAWSRSCAMWSATTSAPR